ncbi:NAD(P)H-binding protein [Thalassomonas sp. M1454]|uniref:NAD(P)H-binding protein n=1 Tax=Thalassomonas sp. M1454 TaxID=2594477 RepID=UPI00117BFB1F|nr:NAD(P)H-binding protein [Thalassomonas sp. M1454]TRX56460.1 NAD-dependent epimerase/dehydratase family protein [Thalassomonas sp. M1454]
MMNNKTALLLGATGLTGKHCLDMLLNNPNYTRIIILVRHKLDIDSNKLEQHIADFSDLSKHSEQFKVNDVFCCLGTTIKKAKSKQNFKNVDFHFVVAAGKISKQQNVDQFIVISAIGAATNSLSFYSQTKGAMETTLKDINLNNLVIFRPSLLLGKRNETRLLESFGSYLFKLMAFLFIGSLKRFSPIQASTLAEQMILSANENNYQAPSYLEVKSYAITNKKQ